MDGMYGMDLDVTVRPVWPLDSRVYLDIYDPIKIGRQVNRNNFFSYIGLNRITILWSAFNSMRNRRGCVVRYNRHVYTYSDWFGGGCGYFLTWRDGISSCSISQLVSRYFYAYRTWPLSGKVYFFCLSHVFLITPYVVRQLINPSASGFYASSTSLADYFSAVLARSRVIERRRSLSKIIRFRAKQDTSASHRGPGRPVWAYLPDKDRRSVL
jgi:hypothetical protein